jgi:glycine cleavage system aminomethyltransferase T
VRCCSRLTGADLGNAAFPFGSTQELEIGYAVVRAQRITYVGELGWELYIPAEFALHVFDRLSRPVPARSA